MASACSHSGGLCLSPQWGQHTCQALDSHCCPALGQDAYPRCLLHPWARRTSWRRSGRCKDCSCTCCFRLRLLRERRRTRIQEPKEASEATQGASTGRAPGSRGTDGKESAGRAPAWPPGRLSEGRPSPARHPSPPACTRLRLRARAEPGKGVHSAAKAKWALQEEGPQAHGLPPAGRKPPALAGGAEMRADVGQCPHKVCGLGRGGGWAPSAEPLPLLRHLRPRPGPSQSFPAPQLRRLWRRGPRPCGEPLGVECWEPAWQPDARAVRAKLLPGRRLLGLPRLRGRLCSWKPLGRSRCHCTAGRGPQLSGLGSRGYAEGDPRPPAHGYSLVPRRPRRTATVSTSAVSLLWPLRHTHHRRVAHSCPDGPGRQKAKMRQQVAKSGVRAGLLPPGGSRENPHPLMPVSLQGTSGVTSPSCSADAPASLLQGPL